MYEFHARLPDDCEDMLDTLAERAHELDGRSGQKNKSLVLARLIIKEHSAVIKKALKPRKKR